LRESRWNRTRNEKASRAERGSGARREKKRTRATTSKALLSSEKAKTTAKTCSRYWEGKREKERRKRVQQGGFLIAVIGKEKGTGPTEVGRRRAANPAGALKNHEERSNV